MRKLAFILAATATLGMAAPAAAQEVHFGIGPGGVGVGVGPSYDYYDRGWWSGPRYRDHYAWGDSNYGECRIVRTQRQRPDGTVAVRTRRVCD